MAHAFFRQFENKLRFPCMLGVCSINAHLVDDCMGVESGVIFGVALATWAKHDPVAQARVTATPLLLQRISGGTIMILFFQFPLSIGNERRF